MARRPGPSSPRRADGRPAPGTYRGRADGRGDASSRRPSPRPAPPRAPAGPPTTSVELTFLPGLGHVLHDEVVERLAPARPPRPVPGREDALEVVLAGPLKPVVGLRTAVAAFVALHFDVPRPRSLTSGDHLARVVAAVRSVQMVSASPSFRFEAAGRDSAVFARLAAELTAATGLPHDDEHGTLVLRVRRGPVRPGAAPDADPGWDVLVRLGSRPLSARAWRVVDYPGAVNATIAAAVARLAGVRDQDRVLNLMCGSGTLLVERLLAGPAAASVAVDRSDEALAATRANLAAAGVRVRGEKATGRAGEPTDVVAAEAADAAALTSALQAAGVEPTFDLVLVDPPWGSLHGSHATAEAVHAGVLAAAHAVTRPGGRLVVLTHEVRVMERCVAAAADAWAPVGEPLRVFAKGHHPRVWLLERR